MKGEVKLLGQYLGEASIPHRGRSKCKGPEASIGLVSLHKHSLVLDLKF